MRGKLFSVVLGAALLAAGLFGITTFATADDAARRQPSFSTPEDAITAYMQGVAQADTALMLQASAIDEMSANFEFVQYIDRLQALHPAGQLPSDYSFYAEMNKAQFTWQLLSQAKFMAVGLLSSEAELADGQTVRMDADGAAQFVAEIDPARLAQIEIMQIALPRRDLVLSTQTQEIWQTQAQMFGADELTERVALFSFEGETYVVGFTLLRYGDDWKIRSASSALSGVNMLGAAEAISADEFQALLVGG